MNSDFGETVPCDRISSAAEPSIEDRKIYKKTGIAKTKKGSGEQAVDLVISTQECVELVEEWILSQHNQTDNPILQQELSSEISVAKYYPYTAPKVLRQVGGNDHCGMQVLQTKGTLNGAVNSSKVLTILESSDTNHEIHEGMEVYEGTTTLNAVAE